MVLNARATSCCSADPSIGCARFEIAPADAPRGRCQVPQRPCQRAGHEPGDGEPERERQGADAHERVLIPADLAVECGHALGDPHGAGRAALLDDRHGRVEQLLVERVRASPALDGASLERVDDLGPVAVVRRPGSPAAPSRPAASPSARRSAPGRRDRGPPCPRACRAGEGGRAGPMRWRRRAAPRPRPARAPRGRYGAAWRGPAAPPGPRSRARGRTRRPRADGVR